MTFLAPLFLIAAAAGLIPVVLHMIHRQRAKQLPFPTLRFLKISVEKTRRRRRVQDLLLMILRTAVLVLVAVALARPTIARLGALWGAGNRSATVVVLDNSASMGTVDDQRPRLETARAAAGRILDEFDEGDTLELLTTGGPAPGEPPRLQSTQQQVRQRLAACRPSYSRANLAARIDQARRLLADSDAANRHIFVITDMQACSWEELSKGTAAGSPGATAGLPSSAEPPVSPVPAEEDPAQDAPGALLPVVVVDCHRTPKPNVAVEGVRLAAALPVAGVPVRATVGLFNASSIAQQRHVELLVDGLKHSISPAIELPPGGHVQHDFVFEFNSGGLHRGEARLVGDDGLAMDDRRCFAMAVDRAVPVALVRQAPHEIAYLDDVFYIEQALAPGASTGSAIRATVLNAADLLSEPLADYRVVFCVNLPAPDGPTAERLARYVAAGGNLVWIAGARVAPEAYNRMNAAAGDQLLPGTLVDVRSARDDPQRDSWNVTFLDRDHAALANLTEPASLYESILVYDHIQCDVGRTPGAWVLARLDDGQPLLVERAVGRGRVVWLGTSCHVDWSNLPLRPIFLPMLLRLTRELAGGNQTQRELLCGQPLVIQPKTFTGVPGPGATAGSPSSAKLPATGVEIERPSGERIRKNLSDGLFSYPDTDAPGIYVVRPLGTTTAEQLAVAVNLDPAEADPRTIAPEQLAARLGDAPLVVVDNPDDLDDVFQTLRQGYSLWEVLLWIVLILLVAETYLANRFVPKQETPTR